jgi:hypothetical protein
MGRLAGREIGREIRRDAGAVHDFAIVSTFAPNLSSFKIYQESGTVWKSLDAFKTSKQTKDSLEKMLRYKNTKKRAKKCIFFVRV